MLTEEEKEQFNEWWYKLKQTNYGKAKKNDISERDIFLKNNPCPIQEQLTLLYNEGYGFKRLAKFINISDTCMKTILIKIFKITTRKGLNVITDKLKEIRSINAKTNKNNHFNKWTVIKPWLNEKNNKSIQGYYKRKHDNQFVWLRSTWEYIYAKWLDKQNIIWYYEEISYKLNNRRTI